MTPPPDAAAFDFEKLHNDGTRWFAYSFPGWSGVLAIGVLAGVPWVVNPLLAGIAVLLTHTLVTKLYNRSLAHIVVLLLAVSPWFLFMSASFMAHPTTLVLSLTALVGVVKSRDGKQLLWGFVAGLALGGLFLTRPLEALLVGAAIGIWALLIRPGVAKRALVALPVGAAIVGGLLFFYNQTLTGSPLRTPHQVMTDARYYPGADRLGFGPEVGAYGWRHLDPLPGHGPPDVAINTHMNSFMSNADLFGWGFGSIGFVVLLLMWRRVSRHDLLFIFIILATVAGHSLFWFSGGPDFGARYWYQILIPLVVLTARGIQESQRRWIEKGGTEIGVQCIGAFVVVASVVAMLTFVPWRGLEKYYSYRGIHDQVAQVSEQYDFGHALVFIREHEPTDYVRALIYNPPTLDSPGTIFVRDLGPESRATVMEHFPDRAAWVLQVTDVGGDYELVSGPLGNP